MFPNFISRAIPNSFRAFGEGAVNDWSQPYPNLNGNPYFTYGTLHWTQTNTADITDNGDGTVHVQATNVYGGIEPADMGSLETGDYIIAFKCTNVTGTGKFAYHDGSNWISSPAFSTDTEQTIVIKGKYIQEMTINAQNDASFAFDIDYFIVQRYHENQIPDMTSNTTPYGVCSASHYIGGYNPWEAFNRSRVDGGDAWVCPLYNPYGGSGEWVQWKYSEATPMAPTRAELYPRAGMATSWYADYNPKIIEFYVIKPDDSLVLIDTVDIGGWADGNKRTVEFNTVETGIGFRVKVVETQTSASTNKYHTGFGRVDVWGHVP